MVHHGEDVLIEVRVERSFLAILLCFSLIHCHLF